MKGFSNVSRAATCASGVILESRPARSVPVSVVFLFFNNNRSPTKFLGDDNKKRYNKAIIKLGVILNRRPAGLAADKQVPKGFPRVFLGEKYVQYSLLR